MKFKIIGWFLLGFFLIGIEVTLDAQEPQKVDKGLTTAHFRLPNDNTVSGEYKNKTFYQVLGITPEEYKQHGFDKDPRKQTVAEQEHIKRFLIDRQELLLKAILGTSKLADLEPNGSRYIYLQAVDEARQILSDPKARLAYSLVPFGFGDFDTKTRTFEYDVDSKARKLLTKVEQSSLRLDTKFKIRRIINTIVGAIKNTIRAIWQKIVPARVQAAKVTTATITPPVKLPSFVEYKGKTLYHVLGLDPKLLTGKTPEDQERLIAASFEEKYKEYEQFKKAYPGETQLNNQVDDAFKVVQYVDNLLRAPGERAYYQKRGMPIIESIDTTKPYLTAMDVKLRPPRPVGPSPDQEMRAQILGLDIEEFRKMSPSQQRVAIEQASERAGSRLAEMERLREAEGPLPSRKPPIILQRPLSPIPVSTPRVTGVPYRRLAK